MSDTSTVLTPRVAMGIADEFVALIRSDCYRVDIAGSLRRGEREVHDIEIVCEPKRIPIPDLFGEVKGYTSNVDERMDELLIAGTVVKRADKRGRPAWGSKYKRLSFKGTPIDLFCVLPSWCKKCGTVLGTRTMIHGQHTAESEARMSDLRRGLHGFEEASRKEDIVLSPLTCPECGSPGIVLGQQYGLILMIRTGPFDFSHKMVTERYLHGFLPNGYRVQDGQLIDMQKQINYPVPHERELFRLYGLPYLEPHERSASPEPWRRLMKEAH